MLQILACFLPAGGVEGQVSAVVARFVDHVVDCEVEGVDLGDPRGGDSAGEGGEGCFCADAEVVLMVKDLHAFLIAFDRYIRNGLLGGG